jgi:hypothetical protein
MHQPAPVLSKVSMKAEQRTRNSLHSLMYREFFEEISGEYPIALPSVNLKICGFSLPEVQHSSLASPQYLRSLESTASRLCYYRALQEGPASVIVPIDKLSILVTVAFSALMLREHVSGRYLLGIAGMCAGAVLMVIG